MEKEVMSLVREAMELSDRLESVLDGEDMFVILMALTKVAGVMLAESEGLSPNLADERTSVAWFSVGAVAAYRGHKEAMKEAAGTMH
jgi:hypothetical protein